MDAQMIYSFLLSDSSIENTKDNILNHKGSDLSEEEFNDALNELTKTHEKYKKKLITIENGFAFIEDIHSINEIFFKEELPLIWEKEQKEMADFQEKHDKKIDFFLRLNSILQESTTFVDDFMTHYSKCLENRKGKRKENTIKDFQREYCLYLGINSLRESVEEIFEKID